MSLQVRPVRSRKDLKRFIDFPFQIHRDSSYWVPPIRSERKRFLDRNKNPFFKHAEAEYFLAERDGQVVGRITACVDELYEKFQGKPDGSFGFFETIDDSNVSTALLDTARGWLRQRGRERMLGPMDFTTNDECGLLIEGYDSAPYFLMPYHPRYYQGLLERDGLTKAMDLLQYELVSAELDFMPILDRLAERALTENSITIRPINMRDFKNELERFFDLYNSAWEENWGFVPLNKDELEFYGKDLKQIIEPTINLVAERDGEVLGGTLCLPNINEILPKLNGRLLPFGWLKFLLNKRKIKTFRVLALGVKPEYRRTGIDAALYIQIRDNCVALGIEKGEMGWILETNVSMNKAMKVMGGEVVKRYRIYQQTL